MLYGEAGVFDFIHKGSVCLQAFIPAKLEVHLIVDWNPRLTNLNMWLLLLEQKPAATPAYCQSAGTYECRGEWVWCKLQLKPNRETGIAVKKRAGVEQSGNRVMQERRGNEVKN